MRVSAWRRLGAPRKEPYTPWECGVLLCLPLLTTMCYEPRFPHKLLLFTWIKPINRGWEEISGPTVFYPEAFPNYRHYNKYFLFVYSVINLKGKQGRSFRGRDETSVQLPMRHGRGGERLDHVSQEHRRERGLDLGSLHCRREFWPCPWVWQLRNTFQV